jgi:hypothetical protein
MASIDKIYGSTKQYDEFNKWIEENNPDLLIYFYPRDGYKNDENRPITNFPEKADMWLLDNCDIGFVIDGIKDQYGIKEI